jgi:hypothetical protein
MPVFAVVVVAIPVGSADGFPRPMVGTGFSSDQRCYLMVRGLGVLVWP